MCWSELFQFTASLLYLNVTNAAGKLKKEKKNKKKTKQKKVYCETVTEFILQLPFAATDHLSQCINHNDFEICKRNTHFSNCFIFSSIQNLCFYICLNYWHFQNWFANM